MPANLDLDLDRKVGWRLSVDVKGCWAPDLDLEPDAEISEVAFKLWAEGHVVAAIGVAAGLSPPKELKVRFESPKTEAEVPVVPATTITCTVEESEVNGGEFRASCPLPSTKLDLRVEAEGFTPHYFWDLQVPAGGSFDLGVLEFDRGASLAGWVTVAARGDAVGVVTLELAPDVLGLPDSPIASRIGTRAIRTEATERGFFQLKNVPLGGYALTARKEGRFSPERVAPIEIKEKREYFLQQPVVLERLARLEVIVDPPVDPYLQQWDLELKRYKPVSSFLEDITGRRPVAADGYWIADELEKGHYVLSLYGSRGSRYERRELEIAPEMPLLQVEVPVVRLEGRLSKGKEPLEATLRFQKNGIEIRFQSDEAGHFKGYLPKDGHWRVKVELADRQNTLHVDRAEVVIEPGEEFAYVDLRLPNTRIRGKVVYEDGQAATPSLVTITGDHGLEMQVWGDENGEFEALGLTPGRKEIRAEARPFKDSGFTSYDLDADHEAEPLELVVRPMVAASFRIWAPSGPVPGALIHFSLPAYPMFGRQAVAGPSGRCTFYLPYSKTPVDVDLVILPPGYARRILRISLPPSGGPPIDIPVEHFGGRLTIGLRNSKYVVHNEVTVPLHHLFDPPDRGKLRGLDPILGTITLEVEAGEYIVCPTKQVTDECASGFLSLGGALSLNARPAEMKQAKRRAGGAPTPPWPVPATVSMSRRSQL